MSNGTNTKITNEIKEEILKTNLFSEEYYLAQVNKNIENPLDHYLKEGYKQGYNPSSEFDTNNYLKNNRDVKEAGMNPLEHYVRYALNSNRKVKYDLSLSNLRYFKSIVYSEKLFDDEYYLAQLNGEEVFDALDHYIYNGWKDNLNPSALFNTENYLNNNVDVKEAGKNPLIHYVIYAFNSYRKINHDLSLSELKKFRKSVYQRYLFDDEYYLSNFSDENIVDPLEHYLSKGYKEGYNPSEIFDTNCFIENNDIADNDINPLLYFYLNDFDSEFKTKYNLSPDEYQLFIEKLYSNKLFDDEYYSLQSDEQLKHPLDDYISVGSKKGLNPSIYFDTKCYVENNHQVMNLDLNPLVDYVLNGLGTDRKVKYDLSLDELKEFFEKVYENELFEDEYYLKQLSQKDVSNPLDHYIKVGSEKGLNPSEFFDTCCYVENNNINGMNPLIYYVLYDLDSDKKVKYNLSISKYKEFKNKVYNMHLFDDEYYLSQYPDDTIDNPLEHYMIKGNYDSKNPSTLFNTSKYLELNPDVAEAGMNPLLHFVLYGIDSNRKFNFNITYEDYKNFERIVYEEKLFDEEYYLAQCEDDYIDNPLTHYLVKGALENKNPSYLFSTNMYLELNPDVVDRGMNPLLHFVLYGMDSDRKFNFNYTYKEYLDFKEKVYAEKLMDDDYYQSQYSEKIIDCLSHYLAEGFKNSINPSYLFNTDEYLKNNDVDDNPLEHFLEHGKSSDNIFNFGLTYEEYVEFKEKAYENEMFDDDYYCTVNFNKEISQPFEHYLVEGYKKGFNPSKFFDTKCYLKNSQDIAKNGLNPFIHYIRKSFNGERKVAFDLNLSKYKKFRKFVYDEGLFDDDYYLKQCGDLRIVDPLDHYLRIGWKENKDPSPLFSTSEYLTVNKDVDSSGVNPLLHFVRYARDKTRHFNYGYSYSNFKKFKSIAYKEGLFDEDYYLMQCSNSEKIIDPLAHYLNVGAKKGYDPSILFSTEYYIKKYPDVEEDGRNPLIHYCLYGLDEDRIIKFNLTLSEIKKFYENVYSDGLFDDEYYLKQCSEKDIDYPVDHYVEIGSKEDKNPSVYFNSKNYLENNPDVFYLNKNPLVHYVVYALGGNRKVNHNLSLKAYKKFREYVYEKELFDDEYYLSQVEDKDEVIDPLEHYLNVGYKNQLNPSENFNTEQYISENEKLKSDENPLIHYANNLLEVYDTIVSSDIFDEEFYISHSEDVEIDESEDLLMHYILKGVKLGLNPSAYFDTNKYYEMYPDVEKAGLNPLYHFIKFGRRESRDSFMVLSNHLKKFERRYQIHSCMNMLNAFEEKVSIIIPIYNAYDETKDCITSVLRNTHINYELILINDCSTDKRIIELLDSLEALPDITVIHNKKNMGFVKNVNLGMSISKHDVVLLNSDTIVTPHWLSHLVYCAYSSNEIGTVTPFSNASDITVPEVESKKDFYYINKTAYHLDRLSYNLNMEAPTGNGFCLFIKRELIDEIGLFDESFGLGYGEETDFTFRAYNAGWLNIRDDAVFVYHKRHASFNEDSSNVLKAKNKKILESRYDDLYELWDEFIHSESLFDSLYRIKLHIHDRINPERILYVTSMENNEPVLDDDFTILSEKYDCFILVLASKQIKLGVIREGRFILYNHWKIDSLWDKNSFIKLYLNMLLNLKIEIVYVRYFYNYYNPNNQNISIFVKLLSIFEIPVLYEATTNKNTLLNQINDLLYPMHSLEELINIKSKEIDFNKYKMVVYTALTGNYDSLITPSVRNPKFDYVCFTDNPDLKSNFWTIRQMDELDLDPIRKARRYKILPHKYLKDYDYSLWIDANFDIIGDIEEYINKYSTDNKLIAIKHDIRNDIYDEAQACIDLEKDNPEIIHKQMLKYKKADYPKNNGLIASGILFRNHNDPEVKQLMDDWYSEVYNYSRRDQLSFNYVCWKNDFKYDESTEFYFKNQYFQRLLHTQDSTFKLQYDKNVVDNILESFNRKTSIIIPIFNAYDETKACIESVLKFTSIPYDLLLIDDCSTDKRIKKLLSTFEKEENIRVITNLENKGFVQTVNLGFEQTDNDVVILNSDTEVTPKWLQKLKITAYMKDNIATVTPFSNNAGAFSVPVHDEDNEIDPDLGVNSTANIIEKLDTKDFLYVPTGNGFCMYIRREAIYSVGFFDQIFGKGYCEENDFCMRLLDKGWKHAIDTSTYILHKHNVSFSTEKDELFEKNRELLDIRYPDYSLKLLNLLKSLDFKDIRDNIALTLGCDMNHKFDIKRVLYLIHEGNGGTLHTSIELMSNLPENVESYILTAGKTSLKLYKYTKIAQKYSSDEDNEFLENLNLLASWDIESEYSIKDYFNSEFRRIYFNILYILKIDLVHIRHLIRHSFDMPYVAKKLGIPVVLSFHDFYYVCPSHNLIDDKDNYCGGICSEIYSNKGQCDIVDGLNAPILKTYIHTWRSHVREMFECIDAFVTTSQSAYDIYTAFYPDLRDKNFEIIEHGRDIQTPDNISDKGKSFNDNKPIRILFPGHINVNKGGWLIKAIKECDIDNKLEFHYMGNIHPKFNLDEIGTHHGYYKRSEFCKEVHEIKPDFIGLLSIWPETYCHTLTESWGCGIPVISLDIGALGERIHKNGGGFFIDNNPQKAYEEIIDINHNSEAYEKALNDIQLIKFKSTKEMAEEYLNLYRKISKI